MLVHDALDAFVGGGGGDGGGSGGDHDVGESTQKTHTRVRRSHTITIIIVIIITISNHYNVLGGIRAIYLYVCYDATAAKVVSRSLFLLGGIR